MERRNMIGGRLIAGLAGIAGVPEAEAAGQDGGAVVNAIERLSRDLRRELQSLQPDPDQGAALVRQQQRTFLRSYHKYPDFIEVGSDIWESIYNWHIKHEQRIDASRLADGRYAIMFMFTRVLMRTDMDPDYVGLGFDPGQARPNP